MNQPINHNLAIQRLTALWALSESGLGGILHAFRLPFTGVVAGGFAIILLTLIAHFAQKPAQTILKSLMVVLIIKAMVSPHSPVMAYLAVSIQAFLAAGIYTLLGIRFLSITLVSLLAMWESAVQKLLILTVFFGKALWEAADEWVGYVAKQMNLEVSNGSFWIAGIYLGIYTLAGVLVSVLTYKLWFRIKHGLLPDPVHVQQFSHETEQKIKKSSSTSWPWLLACLAAILATLYLSEGDDSNAWIKVAKTMSWSLASIFIWYIVLNPLLLKLTRLYLKKKQNQYAEDVGQILQLIPALRGLAGKAWAETKHENGLKRLTAFISLFIFWSLLWEK
jgi:hypothetical protein